MFMGFQPFIKLVIENDTYWDCPPTRQLIAVLPPFNELGGEEAWLVGDRKKPMYRTILNIRINFL